jgi:hypothetical protein
MSYDLADLGSQSAPIPANPRLTVWYCPRCGLFIAASPHPHLLILASRFHACSGWLTFGALGA